MTKVSTHHHSCLDIPGCTYSCIHNVLLLFSSCLNIAVLGAVQSPNWISPEKYAMSICYFQWLALIKWPESVT